MTVPLLDLQLQYASIRDEVVAAIDRVCTSQRFILGPEVEALEAELADAIGVPHAVAVSSGTDALLLALMALGVGPGDEVITPTFSFFATAGSVARLGARPVFVDIDPDTYVMTPEAMARALTSRTRAVIPVHLFGLCADVAALRAALPDHVAIVEDAAQAIGATLGDRQAGALGTLGCFSFFPSKNLGAFGDAGLVTTSEAVTAARVRLLRTHGEETRYHHSALGGNFRMDALQAAVLRVKLPHLGAWNTKRRENARTYTKLIRQSGLAQVVTTPAEPPERAHVYHQYVVRVPRREHVIAHLTARGIGTGVYYPVPFHRQRCFEALASPTDTFPVADALSADVLALPIYPELTLAQQEYVVACLGEALE